MVTRSYVCETFGGELLQPLYKIKFQSYFWLKNYIIYFYKKGEGILLFYSL
uniref:Uncharacterized protein n=1 Tax=Solanum lycopersicum TaxID=4081 RepID=A0A3Q7EC85_SOLLC